MRIENSNSTAPKLSPAIQKYQAAAKSEPKSTEKPVDKASIRQEVKQLAKPVLKRDQVEVSSEARAKLAAEQTSTKERKTDQQDVKSARKA